LVKTLLRGGAVRPSTREQVSWLATWSLAQVLLVGAPTFLRAQRFCFSNFDLGIYSQALAHLSWRTPNPWLSGRQLFLFNDHLDPVLALVAPFTRLAPAVQVGLVAESLFMVLALLPLLVLARAGRLSRRAWWLLGSLQALHVGVTHALGFPFHPTTWAALPMAALGAALLLERHGWALAWLVVLLTCKEEFPFVGLALGAGLLVAGPRRLGAAMLVTSGLWLLGVYGVRPYVLGPVMAYAAQPFDPNVSRLSPKALQGFGDLVVALVPVSVWLGVQRAPAPRAWLLALPLAPLLGIRFLSAAWGDHYGAVVTSCAVMVLAALLAGREVPRWLLAVTVALVLVGNERPLRALWADLRADVASQSPGCATMPGRVEAVRSALELARALPGPLLVGGNLLPWLAERGDVFAVDGPAPAQLNPATILLEKPPRGDRWAVTNERSLAVIAEARAKAVRVLQDDAFVFLAVLR
jgi:hypothetical protein